MLSVGKIQCSLAACFTGFSPYLVAQGGSHLNLVLVPPPLIFLALTRLALTRIARGGQWLRWGLLLGALCVAQFLISSEILASTVIIGAVGLAAAAVANRSATQQKWAHAAKAIATGLALTAVCLAYPVLPDDRRARAPDPSGAGDEAVSRQSARAGGTGLDDVLPHRRLGTPGEHVLRRDKRERPVPRAAAANRARHRRGPAVATPGDEDRGRGDGGGVRPVARLAANGRPSPGQRPFRSPPRSSTTSRSWTTRSPPATRSTSC
jgi:hypothetical protein